LLNTSTERVTRSFHVRLGQRDYDLSARTHIVGVLNVTPDSFSDGGRYLDPPQAIDHALRMVEEGADIIDIGGESTRPRGTAYGEGADPVSVEEELRRTVPVIRALAGKTDIPISIDTCKPAVAAEALDAGAVMVNDISGFTFDQAMAETAARRGAAVALMHIKGTPKTMQADPHYDNLLGEVRSFLAAAVARGEQAGVEHMMIDPGLGFGKTVDHNLALIRNLGAFTSLNRPILVGPSRKSFIGTVLDLPVGERLEGTLAACVAAILAGAHMLRVHDVRAAKRAAMMTDAIRRGAV